MFIAALFIIAPNREQVRWPSTGEWIKGDEPTQRKSIGQFKGKGS